MRIKFKDLLFKYELKNKTYSQFSNGKYFATLWDRNLK